MSDPNFQAAAEGALRLAQVKATTGLSKSTIYRRIAAGEFPHAAIDLGGGIVAWEAADIRAWLAARPRRPAPSRK